MSKLKTKNEVCKYFELNGNMMTFLYFAIIATVQPLCFSYLNLLKKFLSGPFLPQCTFCFKCQVMLQFFKCDNNMGTSLCTKT